MERKNHKTVINCPYLLQPHLSDHQIKQGVKDCMRLSDPGPHVIVLIFKHDECSREDQEHVEKVLNYFPDRVYEHTLVLTTHHSQSVHQTEVNDVIKEIIKKCHKNHYMLERDKSCLKAKLHKMDQMNSRRYLQFDPEDSMEQQVIGSVNKPRLNVVLFGNYTSVQFGHDNILLGDAPPTPEDEVLSRIDPVQIKISESNVSVINMIDFSELPMVSVDNFIVQLMHENKISAFIFVVRVGQLTDADKMCLDWLQSVFGDRVLQFVMILFTYEGEKESHSIIDDLKKNNVLEELVKKCGGRYHICSKTINNQSEMSELMKKIDRLFNDNKEQCYTEEMFNTERRSNLQNNKKDKPITTKKAMEHTRSQRRDILKEMVKKDSSEDTRLEKQKRTKISGKVEDLFDRLHLKDNIHNKLRASDVLQISAYSLEYQESCTEEELVNNYLQKLLMMNYRARYIKIKNSKTQHHTQQIEKDSLMHEDDTLLDIVKELSLSNKGTVKLDSIHPMDVQMAVFHCADSFLKQLMVTKLSQCQFALPLLVPHPFTQQIDFPLWTFRQINKSWKMRNTNNDIISKEEPVYKAETPMVSFFRFGSVSSSKSQLMNNLINEKHNTFFHRNCQGSSRTRLLMDGVVEIAWFCPSGKDTDKFNNCVAFCNLHGDAGVHEKQLQILTEMSLVNVVLLPDFSSIIKVQELYSDLKPLVCLFTEDDSTLIETRKRKYKIGLKDRNQSDVSEELRRSINDCLSSSASVSMFRLEDLSKHSDIRVDEEDDEDCRRGREAAQQMMSLLEKKDLREIKKSLLPHQGKLWHQWCQKNKELHRPQGDEIETDITRKQAELKGIREQQYVFKVKTLILLFIQKMHLPGENMYFLKWLGIFLDEYISKDVKYELTAQQTKTISEKIQTGTFGLEHIIREIGQIYESCSSVKKNKTDLQIHFSSLPSLAAEMMISGFPLELMDGDTAHVPLIWITAVLDKLVQKLGDQRVFVLSVLGLQSSGKSTMLNAMFGLQFAVGAGRCTRGAFMQLIRLSEEMKKQLKFDYILVVDTEGLRSLESDEISTRHHDNELATFVVGLGQLTLINIFGENPAEMQDILQIVVQAFLRMKKVKLNPSCMFVHQNVSDITAREKNMQGKRRLLQTLDEMTKLAAKEEVCDAKCFSDVINFDVQNDVKYFAHLWEGNPPMAPPNPKYCDNIQEIKKIILSHASKSDGMKLTHLRDRIHDLWEALLNERFVFSFRNSLEISVYRRLETEYSKWTWTLRSAMLEIENKLQNQIENEAIHEIEETELQRELKEKSEEVKNSLFKFFDKDTDKEIMIQWKKSFKIKIKDVQESIVSETKMKLNEILQQRELKRKIDAQGTQHENSLLEKSKELALKLKDKTNNEETLNREFDVFWEEWVKKIIRDSPPVRDIDILRDVQNLLRDIYEGIIPVDYWKEGSKYNIFTVQSYFEYVISKKEFKETKETDKGNQVLINDSSGSAQSLSPKDETEIKTFITDVAQQTDKMIQSFNIPKMGYNISYIQQLINYIKKRTTDHQEGPVKYVFKNEFFIDLIFSIFKRANTTFAKQHRKFREANDPVLYVEGRNRKRGRRRNREEYCSIFQKYCHGATSAAIFGEIICQKLKEPIEQSLYKQTARDLADEMRSNCPSLNENRLNLEKHILKNLAEDENFDKYMNYIENPRDHFKSFIRDEVHQYISNRFNVRVKRKMNHNIKVLQQKILTAAHESTEDVQVKSGDVDLWLKFFTQKLSDVLILSVKDFSEVKHVSIDVKLLDVITNELSSIMSDISIKFNTTTFPVNLDNKDRPDEILIDHFCQCCWVQCPFCKATCTNTIENHQGDHSVPFHRNVGLSGVHYQDTTHLSTHICTSAVANSNLCFYPVDSDKKVPWGEYRTAVEVYADWSITSDLSELPYWKWFVCRFQKDLEKHYNKKFEGQGTIPNRWRNYTKQEAIESLDRYS
ncbi:interferon-induced very large GTPase 1-like [Paramisgurnus dabryanus]|uniref:interferon-induced very large GTPase 1-like n=1 Tax=Paramisgurnus dabryanus TaxID=90735 RepID=UPI0031F416E6